MDSRNRRWPLVWLALVTIAFVSVASLGYVELTERDRRIQELEQRIGSNQRLVASMDDRIDNLRIPPDLTSSIALLQGDVSGLQGIIFDLQGTVDDLEGDLSSMWIEIDTVESGLFALADCVNQYMDTIRRWSSSLSSFYTYYYC